MTPPDIQAALDALTDSLRYAQERSFAERFQQLEDLDDLLDAITHRLAEHPTSESLIAQHNQAQLLKHALEQIHDRLFARIREQISNGQARGRAFQQLLQRYGVYDRSNPDANHPSGYDVLDRFINQCLYTEPAPAESVPLGLEMIAYQATPARIVVALAEAAQFRPDDVFYDLGAGLGRVCMLVSLLESVPVRGIEIDPVYCQYATRQAQALRLSQIEFLPIDARDADYANGTVFFLFTPFRGTILQDVLQKLQNVAARRTIRVFTYGPCTMAVLQQPWLVCQHEQVGNWHQLFAFHSR